MKTNFDFEELEGLEPLTKEEKNAHEAKGNVPAVYVGTYKKYNEGNLYGQWIDLTSFDYDYDEFTEYCHRLHADEEQPEFMCQDFKNFPRAIYNESGLPTEDEFLVINDAAAELDDKGQEAFAIYLSVAGELRTIDDFLEHYCGYYPNPGDFAEELFRDACNMERVPEVVRYNIDWEGVFESMELNGEYYEERGYIFQNY